MRKDASVTAEFAVSIAQEENVWAVKGARVIVAWPEAVRAPSMSSATCGAVVPIPTLLLRASMERVVESKVRESTALLRVTSVVCVERSIVCESISKTVADRSTSPAEVRAMFPEVSVERVRVAPVTERLLA